MSPNVFSLDDILETNDRVVTVMTEYKQLLLKDNAPNGLLDTNDQGKEMFTPWGYLPEHVVAEMLIRGSSPNLMGR